MEHTAGLADRHTRERHGKEKRSGSDLVGVAAVEALWIPAALAPLPEPRWPPTQRPAGGTTMRWDSQGATLLADTLHLSEQGQDRVGVDRTAGSALVGAGGEPLVAACAARPNRLLH